MNKEPEIEIKAPSYMDGALRGEVVSFLRDHLNERRFVHSLGVEQTAVALAEHYGEDPQRAQTAGLLHDCGKYLRREGKLAWMRQRGISDRLFLSEPDLIHGYISAELAQKRFGVADEATLDAIRYHTTGRAGMSELERIIYIADIIEPSRDFEGVRELRETAYTDLKTAMLAALSQEIGYVLEKQKPICPLSVEAFNELLI